MATANESDTALFKDRREAGRMLGKRVSGKYDRDTLVLSIPRGGVVVGYEVAHSIGAQLDIVTPRKLRDPQEQELAIGAVMYDGTTFLNYDVITMRNVISAYINKEKEDQRIESERRLEAYKGGWSYQKIRGSQVILVDDGIATGATIIVAARWILGKGATKLVLAVPVMPKELVGVLKQEVDVLECLELPDTFSGIGQFYRDFREVDDAAVIKILSKYWKD